MVSSRALLGAHCKPPTEMLEGMHKGVLARFHDPAALPALSQQTWEQTGADQSAMQTAVI